MDPPIEDRRKHPRYALRNSIMVNHDGVFQLVDLSEGGFSFKCPPYADVLNEWLSDVLTPIGDLRECPVLRKWGAVFENGDFHQPSFMQFGVEFDSLTEDQHDDLVELIDAIAAQPADSDIVPKNVL